MYEFVTLYIFILLDYIIKMIWTIWYKCMSANETIVHLSHNVLYIKKLTIVG